MVVEFEILVCVGGELIVVVVVQDYCVFVGDVMFGQQFGELLGVDEVMFDWILQVGVLV